MPSLSDRQELSQAEKRDGFRRAFEVIKTHRQNNNHLAAYIVSFSVFEDRITGALMWAKDLAEQPRPTKHVALSNRVEFLYSHGHIDISIREDWRAAAQQRNALIHAAMWNVDAFTPESVETAYGRARKADNLAAKLRRLVAKKTKTG